MKRNHALKAIYIFTILEVIGVLGGLIYSIIFVSGEASLLIQSIYFLLNVGYGILFGFVAFGAVLFISAIIFTLVGCVYIIIS